MLARMHRGYKPVFWDDFFNDKFFSHGWTGGRDTERNVRSSCPAVNIFEDGHEYRIELAVPGTSRKDFSIDLENDVMTISSEIGEEKEEKGRQYMRREIRPFAFERKFELPESVDRDHIKASHDAGILSISLPKKEEVVQKTQKQIEIK